MNICSFFSLALNKFADIYDIVQLSLFIKAIDIMLICWKNKKISHRYYLEYLD